MMYGPPAPATEGLNAFAVKPTPLNTPPEGEAVICTSGASSQYTESKPPSDTTGKGLTCVEVDCCAEHPLLSIYKYATVCEPVSASAGSNESPVTPSPLKVPPVGEPLSVAGDA